MSDDNNKLPPSFKPPEPGLQHYKNLRREIVGKQPALAKPDAPTGDDAVVPSVVTHADAATISGNTGLESLGSHRLFDITIYAESEEGDSMTDPTMLLCMAFKSPISGLKLTPEQSQLILAYMHEILCEAEIEEQSIIAEQNVAYMNSEIIDSQDHNNSNGDSSCK